MDPKQKSVLKQGYAVGEHGKTKFQRWVSGEFCSKSQVMQQRNIIKSPLTTAPQC
jgi:hypothetical protein